MRDVNGTTFKLVLGRSDWAGRFGMSAEPDAEGAAVVYDAGARCATLRSRPYRFSRSATGPTLTPSDRTAVARDRYGSWYWIDPDDSGSARIVVRNAGDGTVGSFWSAGQSDAEQTGADDVGPGAFRPVESDQSGPTTERYGTLAITEDHRLVVAATGPPHLLVFDLHAGGAPQRLPWPRETFGPKDAVPRPGGGLYLLDDPEEVAPRLWLLDRTLQPGGQVSPASDFRPIGEDDASATGPASSPAFVSIPADPPPRVLEALPDGTVLVLHEAESGDELRRYRVEDPDEGARDAGRLVLAEALAPDDDAWPDWRAHDIAFVPEAARGTLYVVGRDGNQAYALHLILTADTIESPSGASNAGRQYFPLRRFSGKGLVRAGEEVYYDLGDRWVTLTPQRRLRYVDKGTVASEEVAAFDSDIPGCTWHRVFLDACIPPEASVRLECRASDHRERLARQAWEPQPDLYLRDGGAEVPYYEPYSEDAAGTDGRGTWEVLLQNIEGRYLQVRLTLEGNGQKAPQINALRIHYPRFSYLEEYMPDVYQKDEASASFVERFLAITEGTLTDIEGRIAAAQALFDVRTAPDEYLDWLASWFGASLDPALDGRRKRLFLDHAVELFRQRGTPAGLARMLTLVLDPCVDESLFTPAGVASAIGRPRDADDRSARRESVRIIEEFAARDVPRAVLGDATVADQPREVSVESSWTPADGAETLQRRFQRFLDRERYDTEAARRAVWGSDASFPPLLPAPDASQADQKRADWRVFTRRGIEGPYAEIDAGTTRGDSTASDARPDAATRRFRAFLQRRYRTFDDRIPAAWRASADDFATVRLPRTLPTATAAVQDWMHFVGAVLPMARAAHRFRVLVPVDPAADDARQQRRLDLAKRVVEKQKPAHTAVDVVPYWAAFRVGRVRTGLDSVLDTGSRYAPLLVGEGGLAESTVGSAHPGTVPDRRVTGRDAAGDDRPL